MCFLNLKLMNIMEFCLKWVHMARYELILRLDGALRLTIISKTLLTPKRAKKNKTNPKQSKMSNLTFHQVNFVAGCSPFEVFALWPMKEAGTKMPIICDAVIFQTHFLLEFEAPWAGIFKTDVFAVI